MKLVIYSYQQKLINIFFKHFFIKEKNICFSYIFTEEESLKTR
jgi:hypothetical protein